jgi:hypothetical protein
MARLLTAGPFNITMGLSLCFGSFHCSSLFFSVLREIQNLARPDDHIQTGKFTHQSDCELLLIVLALLDSYILLR